MSYFLTKEAEERTKRFFKSKHGFFWKWKVKPSIHTDEYYNKFMEELTLLTENPRGEK